MTMNSKIIFFYIRYNLVKCNIFFCLFQDVMYEMSVVLKCIYGNCTCILIKYFKCIP